MIIGFDGRVFKHEQITGVERYAHELYDRLEALADVRLLTPRSRSRYGQHIWTQVVLPRLANRENIDVLFCPSMAAPIALCRRRKLVVTIFDLAWFRHPDMYSFGFRTYYSLAVPRIMRRADKVITLSKTERQYIISRFPWVENKLISVYGGVSDAFRDTCSHREEIILSVAALNRHKNLGNLLAAFAKVAHLVPHRVMLVGGNREIISADPALRRAMETIPKDRVFFKGYVPNEELIELYNKADFFVFPSLSEGFGLPPLEAMACGCPVIASDAACIPEVCGDAALYCDPHDPDDIAEKILLAAEDSQLRDQLRQRGFERVRQFTWERCAQEVLAVFEDVLGS